MSRQDETGVREWTVDEVLSDDSDVGRESQAVLRERQDDWEPQVRQRPRAALLAMWGLLGFLAIVGAGTIGYVLQNILNDDTTTTSGTESIESTEAVVGSTSAATDGAATEGEGGEVETADADSAAGSEPTSPVTLEGQGDVQSGADAGETTLSPEEIQAKLNELAGGDPTPRAEMGRGHLTFLGAVPDQEIANMIIEGAKLDLGPDNVTDKFVVDPTSTWTPAAGLTVDIAEVVLFEVGSNDVDPDFVPIFAAGVELMDRVPGVTFTIIGHTDASGTEDFNYALSESRIEAVIDMWVGLGAERDRLVADPRGESEASGSDDPNVAALDRRTEFIVNNILGGPPPGE